MSSKNETLTIEKCPHCRNSHKFSIEVERSISMTYTSLYSAKHNTRYFTRLFTCPKTGRDFEARFPLTESSHSTIESVIINGIAEEKNTDDDET